MCSSRLRTVGNHGVTRPWMSMLSVIVAQAAIGHCQYTWTLFVPALQRELGVSLAQVQLGFSLFVTCQTTSVLGLGVIVPRRLHQLAMCSGSILVGVMLCGLSASRHLATLYSCCALMGVGVGFVYNGCVSLSVSLYPRNRGMAAGLSAAAYGGGTLFTVAFIEDSIERSGHAATLRVLGLAVGASCLLSSSALPSAHWRDVARGEQVLSQGGAVRLSEAVRGGTFWLLYLMLVLITFIGLVVTAQLRPLAEAFSVPPASLVLALQVDRVLNGLSRPLWGILSDHFGRADTLALAFGLQAAVLLYWAAHLADPITFVLCSGLSTFSWGEVYSLFPAMAADLYGASTVSATFGALYTGKAAASFLAGPVASVVAEHESWEAIIGTMALLSLADSLLAACALKRLMRAGTERRCATALQQQVDGQGGSLM